jgi:pimeloyl-ACP methyl ester carboxylesterase
MSAITGLAEVNGTKLYYEMRGEGHPLVLISGGGSMDRRMWDDQFKPFAEHYKVIRYDIRGIGKSEMPQAPFSHIQDLHSLLRFLNIDQAYLLGLSFGGSIAIDVALAHPEMIDALIPVAPGLTGYQFSDEYLRGFAAMLEAARHEGISRAVQMILATAAYPPPEHIVARRRIHQILIDNAQAVQSLSFVNLMQPLDPPAIGRLSEIRIPTLIVVGDRDHPDHDAIVDTLKKNIAGARKIVISGAGHIMNMEKPQEFNRVVLDFLDRQP